MIPEDILDPLIERSKIERFEIPNTLIELLFELLQWEIERNFPSLQYTPEYEDGQDDPALRLAKGLLHVYSKLPRIFDSDPGKLTTTVGQVAHINDEDVAFLHGLCTPVERCRYYEQQRRYEQEIATYEKIIDRSDAGKNVSRERIALRHAKDALKKLTEPDPTPYLTSFWRDLFALPVSFEVPHQTRFEHTHILADTGMGKSVLLRHLVHQDIQSQASVIVLSPKGQLIPETLRLKALAPERIVYISPDNDLTLNPFDLGITDDKIRVNQSLALLDYVFEPLDVTEKQQPLLNNCIKLMLYTPGSSLPMLKQLLQETQLPARLLPYAEKLDKNARDFFLKRDATGHTRFSDPAKTGYKETKQELLWRFDNILGTAVQEMFSGAKSSVTIPSAMAAGKVILVNTSSKVLGVKGSSFLGRFFLGMTAIAAIIRDGEKILRPAYLYLDEVDLYASRYLQELLVRGREACVGVTLAHQWLNQLKEYEQSAYACSTKFVGGLQHTADARTMAGMMKGVDPAILQHQEMWHFFLQVRGFTKRAMQMDFGSLLADLNTFPRRTDREMGSLMHGHKPFTAPAGLLRHLKAAEPAIDGEYIPAESTDDLGTGTSKKW